MATTFPFPASPTVGQQVTLADGVTKVAWTGYSWEGVPIPSNYNAADVLAKLVTVDGAGSGLDADLLDGQSGAYYTPPPLPLSVVNGGTGSAVEKYLPLAGAAVTGVVSLPAQPSFFAYGTNQAGQNSDFIFGFTYWNIGNRYNTSNGRFTATTAGIYFFRFNVMADSPGGPYEIRLSLYKNGGSPGINYILNKPATAYLSMEVSGHVYLGVGDYVTARYVQGIATWYVADSVWSSFSGHFVG